jgi:diaminohydroxyphosphoribosylaminopyrimidine deaminase/5-amino-6-(5-phosphoribosylamino)uracil reductase
MHQTFLQHALELAKIRRGFCSPNPSVGAVLVKNNKIIAEGYHFQAGHPHAEVEALKKIKNAEGAVLYITLEPCCHFGKTPPCTDLIIQRKIKKVIFGMHDFNPQVAKKSLRILQSAGIECEYFPLSEINEFYNSYHFWWKYKRPFVTAKLAFSFDGKIAGENGKRINITGKTAQLFTHQQRKASDAILTTAKTILCDDPRLDVRLKKEKYKKPIYIVDSKLSIPLDAKVFSTAQSVTLFYSENRVSKKLTLLKNKKINLIPVKQNADGLDLKDILKKIGKDGVHDLWVEAGGELFSSLIQKKLLNRAFIYVAPKWLGEKAQSAFNNAKNIFKNAKNIEWQPLGDDAVCQLNF